MPNAPTISPSAPRIILCTLNAKYIHASLGLRYLLANMARHGGEDLRAQTVLREFTIARPPQEVADALLAELGEGEGPQVIGFGVYIWNIAQTTELVRLLKVARPGLKIVLGGPEVSHEWEGRPIVQLADHLITGWGDVSFPRLCRAIIHGPRPLMKVITGEQPPLDDIVMPYAEYSDADLAHRLLYVEASRGCPFKCEFCLSSLDKTAWAFDLDAFLAAMDGLYRRGARNFKFVDRTFNLKIDASLRVLQFFLERLTGEASEALFLHFEVVPDHLPDRLKEMIARFPPGVLQFEVGIQSFNPVVQQTISRRQDNARSEANLHWLANESHAHLHTDLIFGLPGETLESFAEGFDRLYALGPHEIQLGILKRLPGTPIARHSAAFGMVYEAAAPYIVTQTDAVDAATMLRFKRLARYWDMLANSGRFQQAMQWLMQGESAFAAFWAFSDWLWQRSGKTTGLTPEMLLDALFDYFTVECGHEADATRQLLLADYLASGARSNPACLQGLLAERGAPARRGASALAQRQARHGG
ncbi:radical SAM protein [Uliginosibacterium sp. 31-16]|uniref:B12-binding domain-containing radical SAM protein n=1 Tax=Uliginosibacterium sp. 31-16 TaxID=3068315 RepID=UPI00273F4AE5|nr:radical SAM protein [Uliginosibacterium sp. 31-16]MDP5239833.1 radical SAM protein [Uliginosibacterium sp. 31-16]